MRTITPDNHSARTIPAGCFGRTYDISPDGPRFLLLKPVNEPDATPPQLVVMQHFDEVLK